ncbi:MAG: hypothetical protein RXO22_06260 [Thermocladium sp.]
MICSTINDNGELEIFSKADYIVLMDGGKIIHKEKNPALEAKEKRPTVAKRCLELGADTVIAPHGSLCLPSYTILNGKVKRIYIARRGEKLSEAMVWPVNMGEIAYSSFLATWERLAHLTNKSTPRV